MRKTLQAWLDTREKGNITGQTGKITFWAKFYIKKNNFFQVFFGLGQETDGKMDTSIPKRVRS